LANLQGSRYNVSHNNNSSNPQKMFAAQANAYKLAEEFAKKKEMEADAEKANVWTGASPTTTASAAGTTAASASVVSDEASMSSSKPTLQQEGSAWDEGKFVPTRTEKCKLQARRYILQKLSDMETLRDARKRMIRSEKILVFARSVCGLPIGKLRACFDKR